MCKQMIIIVKLKKNKIKEMIAMVYLNINNYNCNQTSTNESNFGVK